MPDEYEGEYLNLHASMIATACVLCKIHANRANRSKPKLEVS